MGYLVLWVWVEIVGERRMGMQERARGGRSQDIVSKEGAGTQNNYLLVLVE